VLVMLDYSRMQNEEELKETAKREKKKTLQTQKKETCIVIY
jgi:hypothetical protein